ncbi:MAG: hypothetical protein IPP57_21080 [Candidatus Obscuribacter sp.]|nr:hypothetical protein [Candidatus Obscuribacter sp.]
MQESPKLRRLTTSSGLSALVCRGAVIALLLLLNHLEPVDGQFVSPFAEYSQNQPILVLADAAAREALHLRRIDSSGVAIDEVTMLDGASKEIYFADSAGNMPLRELVFYVGKKSDGSKMLNLETIYSPIDGGILKEFTYSPSGQLRGTGVVYATDKKVKEGTGEKARFRREFLDPLGRLSRVVDSTLKGAIASDERYSADGARVWQRINNLAESNSWAIYHYFADGVTIKRREVRTYAYFEVEDFYDDGITVSCHSQVYQWRNNLTCYRPDGTYEYMITKVRKASQLEVSSFDLKGALLTKRIFRQEIVPSAGQVSTIYELDAVTVYSRRHGMVGTTEYKIAEDGTVSAATTNGQAFRSGLRKVPADWLVAPSDLVFAAEVEAKEVDAESAAMGRL